MRSTRLFLLGLVITASLQAAPPSAPAGLTARGGTGIIGLNWDDVAGATSYRVYEAASASGPFALAATRDRSRHLVANAPAGVARHYRVTAVNGDGEESAVSATVSATADASSLDRAATAGHFRVGSSFVTDSDRLTRFLQARSISVAGRRFQVIGAAVEYIWSNTLATAPTTFNTEIAQLQGGSHAALVMNAQRPWEQGERELDGVLLFGEEALAARPGYRVFIHEYWIDDEPSRTSLWAEPETLADPATRARQQRWYWLTSVALAYEATRQLGAPVYVAPIGSAVEAAKNAAVAGQLQAYATRSDFHTGDAHLNHLGKYLQEGVVAAGAYQIDVRGTHAWVDGATTLTAADAAKLQAIIHETVRATPFSGWHAGAPTTLADYLAAMRHELRVHEGFDDFTAEPGGSTIASATNARSGLAWNYTRSTLEDSGTGRAEYGLTRLEQRLRIGPGGTLSTTLPDGLRNFSLRLSAPDGGRAEVRVSAGGVVLGTLRNASTTLRGRELRGLELGGVVNLAIENVGTTPAEIDDLIWEPAGTADGGVVVLTDALANAAQGTSYGRTLKAHGAGTVAWSVVSGALPAGLQLSAGGVLSGTPTALGTSTFTVRATDSGNGARFGERTLTIRVARPTVLTTAPAPRAVALGHPLVLSAGATGDELTYAWYRDGELLPDAVAATYETSAAGLVDAGAYTVRVSGAGGTVESAPAAVAVSTGGATRLTTTFAANAVTAGGNTFDLTNTGTRPIVVTGRLEGNFNGGSSVVVTAYRRAGTASGKAGSPDGWTLWGQSEAFTGRGFGFATPFVLLSGGQPAGITIAPGETVGVYLRASGNLLRYTAGTAAVTQGSLRFTPVAGLGDAAPFAATVYTGRMWNGRIEFYEDVAPVVTSATPAAAVLGLPFQHVFAVTAGNGELAPVLAGPLPGGVTFDAATRTLAGTPTAAGSFNLMFTAGDFDDDEATQAFTWTVVDPFVEWLQEASLPAQADPSSDPMGEGVALRLRHVLGLPANERVAHRLPSLAWVDGEHRFTFSHDPTATGVRLVVQTSTDLANWSDVHRFLAGAGEDLGAPVYSKAAGAEGVETITLRYVPAHGEVRRFFRVSAEPAW